MKSKRSCFNRGIAKNLLQRCWPLWASYLAFLLLILPLPLRRQAQFADDYFGRLPLLDSAAAGMAEWMIGVSFIVSVLAAMVVFSYLYNTRACGMMNALPVTRSCVFFTVWLTGLVPLLLADLLAAALCLPFVALKLLSPQMLWALLAVMILGKLCFFGFASLCAMLTGSIIILPMVYAVLSLTAFVAELATRFVLSKVIYGLDPDVKRLTWLSPVIQMMASFNASGEGDRLVVSGLGVMAAYGAAGLLFTLLAWRLYLRRQMETATDTVAIPVLKPVFKYCMAYGCGVLLAAFFHDAVLMDCELGLNAALLTVLAVLVGSLIGYFAAEMLIRKTVRVFRGSWRGWLVFAALAALVIGACEFDLFGWEKSQPKEESIRAVSINDTEYTEAASIRKILELQQSLVAHKAKQETPVRERVGNWTEGSVRLRYYLNDGRTVSRSYEVIGDAADMEDENSDIAKLQTVFNLPEALRWRSLSKVQVVPDNVIYFQAEYIYYNEALDGFENQSIRFSPEEAVDFYENALLSDLAENRIGRRFLWDGAGPGQTNVNLYMELVDQQALEAGAEDTARSSWYSITVYDDNAHCLEWLRAHSDQEIDVLRGGNWLRLAAAG